MIDWLSKLDPNALVAILGAVFGYLKLSGGKAKRADIAAILTAALKQKVTELLTDPDAPAKARVVLEQAATMVLDRLGIKRTAMINWGVNVAVEAALAELGERFLAYQLAQLKPAMQKMADGVDASMRKLDGLAPIGEELREPTSGTLEVVEPDAAADRARAMLGVKKGTMSPL